MRGRGVHVGLAPVLVLGRGIIDGLAPVDVDGRHVVVFEGLMLVVAEDHDNVWRGCIQRLGKMADGALAGVKTGPRLLLAELGGEALRAALLYELGESVGLAPIPEFRVGSVRRGPAVPLVRWHGE